METNVGGRPPIGPVQGVRVPPDLWERLGSYAEERGITRSEAIRRACEQLLDADEPDDALLRSALEILVRVSDASDAHLMQGLSAPPDAAARRVADGLRHMRPSAEVTDDERRVLVRAAGRASDLLGQ